MGKRLIVCPYLSFNASERKIRIIRNSISFDITTLKDKVYANVEVGIFPSRIALLSPSGKHVRAMNTPLEPHFYIAKLVYGGVTYFFLFLLQNIDCGYSLEPPRRGGSNVYPQFMF